MLALLTVFLMMTSVRAQFSAADKQDILEAHNLLRSQIALGTFSAKGKWMPAAADMLKMEWSSELEASAQAYSSKCVFAHSHTQGLGENLYYIWSPSRANITGQGKAACQMWAQEFQDYGWLSVFMDINVFNTGIGHATQMAWAKTNQVGCGASLCQGGQQVLVVCQYKPQGNILQTYAYTEGRTCSQCPTGTSCETATGLCVAGIAPTVTTRAPTVRTTVPAPTPAPTIRMSSTTRAPATTTSTQASTTASSKCDCCNCCKCGDSRN